MSFSESSQQFAQVYIDLSFRDKAGLYSIPFELLTSVSIGSRVLVSVAKGIHKKENLGFVASLLDTTDEEPLGEIIDVLDNGNPMISPLLMRLAEWITQYYISFPIETLFAMLPSALRIRPKETVSLKEFALISPNEKIIKTELRRSIMEALSKENHLTIKQLERRLLSKNLRTALRELERIGLIQVEKTYFKKGKPKFKPSFYLAHDFSDGEIGGFKKTLQRSKKLTSLLDKILTSNRIRFFPEDIGSTSKELQSLVEKGILSSEKTLVSSLFTDHFTEPLRHLDFTLEQQFAINEIEAAINKNVFQTILLHGITGSGKTWIYIEAIRKTLEKGRTIIVLVPEISLTPQTASRFRSHFGEKLRVIHSKMSDSEKFEAWQSLKSGEAKIALGARSAVFAPLENVGLIVVDEEHESSYKQYDVAPRYHARDVAIVRGKFENAVCILGSATPSIESYYNAEIGKYRLLTLNERQDGTRAPDIKLIWLPKDHKISPSISETLYLQIKSRIEKNEQVILFQNRRGYSGSVQCQQCGEIVGCPACQVAMVFHLKENHLRCHYCGRTQDVVSKCKKCGSIDLQHKSSGTEKIEHELQQLFPSEKILRMDLDTTVTKGAHAKLLTQFQSGNASILLGTQMVAKGLDFPNVTLVGALLADIGLSLPDFRSGERLYSLLLQVAGRAGRAQKKGEVYFQVLNLNNDVFKYVLTNNYKHFYHYEKEIRYKVGYPPFVRLAKLEFSGKEELAVRQAAVTFQELLKDKLDEFDYDILGPIPAVIKKIKYNFRYQILVKQKNGALLSKEIIRALQSRFRQQFTGRIVKMNIDIDTQSVM